ncbi:centrosomal protein of 70 kDa isoform X1 [Sorex araneus]|uniref:centrosomal protein of 70 kDa isoform X1 n=2 Tax=Sorex araneus TaxID=42254 RepID=UPI002433DF57|nr:centrosomal protein of 70 kDa isoform X1 [Sorex araneus]XP_054984344.1 centrosomal protein of 70 kDa isoform X1 [Sorex araneus]XP_054984345.1 centrosomal protein of 70 kDa isoform X1 [Sorex araneus]XP_054984346.1 centrosomal protein of 70 kDa isoform X1 [Sorex araneus]
MTTCVDSPKEALFPVAPKIQESCQPSNRFMTDKQQEEAEWENINVLLLTRGLKPLCLVKKTDLKDFIIFDKQSSQKMRQNLKTLMEETACQQNLIRELIETNQQLKDALQQEQCRAACHEKRANELEQIMENVKTKIGELEDGSLNRVCQQQNQIKDLQKEQKALQIKCQNYKKKRMEQQETISSLQKDIYRLTKEEEDRIITQNRVFSHLCQRVPHSVLDRQLLCLIDYYESKIRKICKQRQYKDDESLSEEEKDYRNLGASPTYKGLLMSLQNQLGEARCKIDTLLHDKLNLQKDLDSRPTLSEFRLYKEEVKRLERALRKNIRLQNLIGEGGSEDREQREELCKDSDTLLGQRYFQVLCGINEIIHHPRAPVVIYKQSKGGCQNFNQDFIQECGFEHLIPILEMWAEQLSFVKELYKSLKILSAELMPWHNLKKQDENEGIRVEDLLLIVDTMLEEVENKGKGSSTSDFQTLQAIVSHFQKLFDVPSLCGVFPRMNEVYTRLGELNNVVRYLQELLELDNSSSLYVLVDTVGKLCRLVNEGIKDQVVQVLGPEDVQSIIHKLEEHEEFFPAFQAFTNDLLEVLEIDDLDAIVPAVKKLKVLSY